MTIKIWWNAKNMRQTSLLWSWTDASISKVFSITYLTEVLPWQQAKYSSSGPDKGTQDKCDAPHRSNSNSLVLLLSAKMCSHFGDYWPIFVDVPAKRLNTAHRVPATSSLTHKACQKKATLLELASIFMAPPPHPLSKRTRQKFLNVSGREFASHFQNAMAFGQLAPMRSGGRKEKDLG